MQRPLELERDRPWRAAVLALALVAPLLYLLSGELLPQDPAYHAFADTAVYAGVPNFMNVVSNVPFLLVGAAGLVWCLQKSACGAVRSWTVLFLGMALVCFGSAYYHWMPDSESLVWDRLPMTLAFTALLVALLAENVGSQLERALLVPAVAAGITSIAWWQYADDLRVYYWVQGAPLLAIPLVLVLYRGAYTHRQYLLYALVFYALAKAAEFHDSQILALTQHVSGHTLKHLLAAAGSFCVYLMLRRRAPRAQPETSASDST